MERVKWKIIMVHCGVMVLAMLKQETRPVHSLVHCLDELARIAQSILAKVNLTQEAYGSWTFVTRLAQFEFNWIFRNLKAYSTQTETKLRHLTTIDLKGPSIFDCSLILYWDSILNFSGVNKLYD